MNGTVIVFGDSCILAGGTSPWRQTGETPWGSAEGDGCRPTQCQPRTGMEKAWIPEVISWQPPCGQRYGEEEGQRYKRKYQPKPRARHFSESAVVGIGKRSAAVTPADFYRNPLERVRMESGIDVRSTIAAPLSVTNSDVWIARSGTTKNRIAKRDAKLGSRISNQSVLHEHIAEFPVNNPCDVTNQDTVVMDTSERCSSQTHFGDADDTRELLHQAVHQLKLENGRIRSRPRSCDWDYHRRLNKSKKTPRYYSVTSGIIIPHAAMNFDATHFSRVPNANGYTPSHLGTSWLLDSNGLSASCVSSKGYPYNGHGILQPVSTGTDVPIAVSGLDPEDTVDPEEICGCGFWPSHSLEPKTPACDGESSGDYHPEANIG